ncbi:MAG: aminotransferase class I/II-fold pyridoxal phosphate-dependent enzyme, partial [Clostridiales bacterium]|nr:aminotransferase class I/II-fold pyridoxal phosphate-dependent enzyme [Clostridiales bacterium]
MSRFLSKRFCELCAYVPGEQPKDMEYIKLNTNESPYPPAPEVMKAIDEKLLSNLRLYSDPECKRLRESIARENKVNLENVFLGNGSDEVLSFIFMAFCDKGERVSYPDISYGFYSV